MSFIHATLAGVKSFFQTIVEAAKTAVHHVTRSAYSSVGSLPTVAGVIAALLVGACPLTAAAYGCAAFMFAHAVALVATSVRFGGSAAEVAESNSQMIGGTMVAIGVRFVLVPLMASTASPTVSLVVVAAMVVSFISYVW